MNDIIISDWQIISKETVETKLESWISDTPSIEILMKRATSYADSVLNQEYNVLRKELLLCYRQAQQKSRVSKKAKYTFDMEFGISFYSVLQKYGFNSRYASVDLVWYYIALNVIPEIIIWRFYDNEKPTSIRDHFYKISRRIYPKTIWWYIYLAQNNNDVLDAKAADEIRNLLKGNDSDTILQMVERSGDFGYRRDLYYEILRQYSMMTFKNPIPKFLRKILILNTARTKVVEPMLFEGGIPGYVKSLYGYFNVMTK